jgi:hypothetical protein
MMTFPEQEMETVLCLQDEALCLCLPLKIIAPFRELSSFFAVFLPLLIG